VGAYSQGYLLGIGGKRLMKKRRSVRMRPLNCRVSSIMVMRLSPAHADFCSSPSSGVLTRIHKKIVFFTDIGHRILAENRSIFGRFQQFFASCNPSAEALGGAAPSKPLVRGEPFRRTLDH